MPLAVWAVAETAGTTKAIKKQTDRIVTSNNFADVLIFIFVFDFLFSEGNINPVGGLLWRVVIIPRPATVL
jgi:hypothetical protein